MIHAIVSGKMITLPNQQWMTNPNVDKHSWFIGYWTCTTNIMYLLLVFMMIVLWLDKRTDLGYLECGYSEFFINMSDCFNFTK